jgi:hypothetical protein
MSLTLVHFMAGMFHYANIYALTNSGLVSCTLKGFPSVSVFAGPAQNASTAITVPTSDTKVAPWGEHPIAVTIKPGRSAGLILGYVVNPDATVCRSPNDEGPTFKVTLPGTTSSLVTDDTHFDVCSGGRNYPLYVSPILPQPRPVQAAGAG